MRGTWTLTQRELQSFFWSPIAYVVMVVFLILNGFMFGTHNLVPGQEASLRPLFGNFMPIILMFIIPMLTMRLISEEFRSGTIESLMTTPVSDAAVIMGKFFGALLFYGFLLATTLLYAAIVAMFGSPDYGAMFTGYLGLVLVGALYIAIGLFFSTCTSNQIIAVICSFAVLAVIAWLSGALIEEVEGTSRVLLQHVSIQHQFLEFVQGAINLNNLTYFLTTTAFFLFISVKVLESRRWR